MLKMSCGVVGQYHGQHRAHEVQGRDLPSKQRRSQHKGCHHPCPDGRWRSASDEVVDPHQTHRQEGAYGGRYGEDADGEIDHRSEYHDVLAGDGEDVGYPGALECFLQFLGHERAVPEYHAADDGRLAGSEAVTERHAGTAVYLTDPTPLLSHRLYARRLDERANLLQGELR